MPLQSKTKKRVTNNSRKSQAYANRAIRAGRQALLLDICKGMHDAYIQNDHRLPYGHVRELLNEFGEQYDWLSRNIINKAFIKYRKEKATKNITQYVPASISLKSATSSGEKSLSTVSTMSESARSSIGRPVGSTEEKKAKTKKKLIEVKNEIACKFAAIRKSTKRGKRMRKGQLEEIIEQVKADKGIECEILPSAIRQRPEHNSL